MEPRLDIAQTREFLDVSNTEWWNNQ